MEKCIKEVFKQCESSFFHLFHQKCNILLKHIFFSFGFVIKDIRKGKKYIKFVYLSKKLTFMLKKSDETYKSSMIINFYYIKASQWKSIFN